MVNPKGQRSSRKGSSGVESEEAGSSEGWSPDFTNTETYPIKMPLPGLGRIMGRQTLDFAGRLIDFALTSQVRGTEGNWLDVVRVDSKHGTVHAHYFSPTGVQRQREEILRISSHQDVDRGYMWAEAMLTEQWHDNLKGW